METILLNPYLIVSARTNTYHISQKDLQTFLKNKYISKSPKENRGQGHKGKQRPK